ncbi:hypothetical protein SEUBUCD646_0D00890 [Saccharomyces eubayanus]|uniref:FANCM-MHF complex subunit Mhf2 n=2 Tax=Saccharomyces TaxID=4930 RepID=A0A6C1E3Z1_SACPS|nr:FANCM-MHF complex subunit Mhf2 [Saccharomyces pastorianus]CAI1892226.1 hypothetical protein SEUBUCD650_0D00880 [Saccharomyces eubayanus]CAI1925892.1 hypothetical protein SEUBUCD646_0D00890 [Saccharomyces eubayanus]
MYIQNDVRTQINAGRKRETISVCMDEMMLSKEAIIEILSQNNGSKNIKIADEVILMIQKYLDIFIEEAALRSLQSHKDSPEAHDDGGPFELSHLDLERIVGLLLMDM